MANGTNNTQKVSDVSGKTITYINPEYTDTSKFGLNLFGAKTSNIAEYLNENFLRLTQSFYGSTQPTNPVIGQTWIDSVDNTPYRWFGNNWVQVNRDVTYDAFMYVKYDTGGIKEFVLDEFVFNFTMNNIMVYNQDMIGVKFIIDAFDSRKIIIKDKNITELYILVFHPKDKISNPKINKKMEIYTKSGQTHIDIESLTNGNNINTLTVSLNDVVLKNNEFFIENNVLHIDGMIYRVRTGDKVVVWMYGGSLASYHTTVRISISDKSSYLKIPKFFKSIDRLEIVDVDEKTSVNPIDIHQYNDYVEFEFLNKKNIVAYVDVKIV